MPLDVQLLGARGYATEAAVLVPDWWWNELRLPRLISIIQHGNDRSVRLARNHHHNALAP